MSGDPDAHEHDAELVEHRDRGAIRCEASNIDEDLARERDGEERLLRALHRHAAAYGHDRHCQLRAG